ncbi:MAG: hypothetical protein K2X55_16785 [Burkholderiaceae bacterium]|nr:hypothetical protein [Burkholderiaceae bacterium]
MGTKNSVKKPQTFTSLRLFSLPEHITPDWPGCHVTHPRHPAHMKYIFQTSQPATLSARAQANTPDQLVIEPPDCRISNRHPRQDEQKTVDHLEFNARINADGKAASASIIQAPGEEIGEIARTIILRQPFKPSARTNLAP